MSLQVSSASNLAQHAWSEPAASAHDGAIALPTTAPYALEPSYHPQLAGWQAANADAASFDAQVRGREGKAVDLELAQIAQAVYDPGTRTVGDWTRLDDAALLQAGIDPASLEDPGTGFRAGLYTDGEGRYVLAFAGSNDLNDWLNNLRQGIGIDAEQYEQAAQLAVRADTAFGDQLVITGHSLGGGLAATASLATGNAAVTFNAAGVSDATIRDLGLDPAAAKADAEAGQIRRYAVEGELLTRLQEDDLLTRALMPDAIGHAIELSDPDPLSFWERLNPYEVLIGHPTALHMMNNVVQALRNDAPWAG